MFVLSLRSFSFRSGNLFKRNFFKAAYFLRIRCRTSPSIQGGEFLSPTFLIGICSFTAVKNRSFQFDQCSFRRLIISTKLFIHLDYMGQNWNNLKNHIALQ